MLCCRERLLADGASAPSKRCQQPTGGRFAQIEHGLEALGAAVIRVRDFVQHRVLCVFEEQFDFGPAVRRAQLLQGRDVLAVHGQQQIKVVKVLRHHLSRTQCAKLVAAFAGSGNRPAVWRTADMPIPGTGGIDAAYPSLAHSTFLLSQGPKHTLGRR